MRGCTDLLGRRVQSNSGYSLIFFAILMYLTEIKQKFKRSEILYGRVAQGNSQKGTESTKVNWKCRIHISVLAFPACQEDGTCPALRDTDVKGNLKSAKWSTSRMFFLKFILTSINKWTSKLPISITGNYFSFLSSSSKTTYTLRL